MWLIEGCSYSNKISWISASSIPSWTHRISWCKVNLAAVKTHILSFARAWSLNKTMTSIRSAQPHILMQVLVEQHLNLIWSTSRQRGRDRIWTKIRRIHRCSVRTSRGLRPLQMCITLLVTNLHLCQSRSWTTILCSHGLPLLENEWFLCNTYYW